MSIFKIQKSLNSERMIDGFKIMVEMKKSKYKIGEIIVTKVKLNFLLEKRAIFCGDLCQFGNGYARYLNQEEDTKERKGVYVILSEKTRVCLS